MHAVRFKASKWTVDEARLHRIVRATNPKGTHRKYSGCTMRVERVVPRGHFAPMGQVSQDLVDGLKKNPVWHSSHSSRPIPAVSGSTHLCGPMEVGGQAWRAQWHHHHGELEEGVQGVRRSLRTKAAGMPPGKMVGANVLDARGHALYRGNEARKTRFAFAHASSSCVLPRLARSASYRPRLRRKPPERAPLRIKSIKDRRCQELGQQ